jgi:phosphoribosylglycinamide formyltransferase-1
LNNYKNRIVNFHPSILPSFPGLMAIDQALASGVQFLGNTAHIINKGIDTGPIIMQSVLKRQAYSKYEDVLNLQIPMLEKIWLLLDGDNLEVGENFVQINSEGSQYNSFFSV